MVRHVSIDYKVSARLDDNLIVSCVVKTIRPTGVIFAQQANRVNDGILLVYAEVEVVCVSMDKLRPRPIPDLLLNQLQIKAEKNNV